MANYQSDFGDLTYGDDQALQGWLTAHDADHRAQRQAIINLGVSLNGWPLLTTQTHNDSYGPNSEWFGRHALMHVALQRFFQPDNTVASLSLTQKWVDETSFRNWQQMHDKMHQQLNNKLGIT